MEKTMPYVAFPEITEDLQALRDRLHRTRDNKVKPRLHLLVLIKSNQVRSRSQAGRHLAVDRATIRNWLDAYQEGGLERLLTIKKRGKPPGQRTLPEAVYRALQKRLDEPVGFASFIEVQRWLYDEFGLEVPYKSVYNLVRYHMKAKLKRPRPEHPKKTEAKPLHS